MTLVVRPVEADAFENVRETLLEAACAWATARGAEVLEAYPAPEGGPSYRFMGPRRF